MIVTEAWELLMNSPKVIMVKHPAFLINLEDGKLIGHLHPDEREHDHVKPLTLSMRNLDEDLNDVQKIIDENDIIYLMGDMNAVFRKHLIPSDMTISGLDINFVRYTLRYAAITNAQLLEWYNQSVHTKAEVAKCQAKKDNG